MDAQIRSRSLLLSLLIHTALLLLLLFVVMKTSIPPFPESGGGGGVLVNIGYIDAATGEIQPMSETVTQHPQPVTPQPVSPSQEQQIATQDMEDAPVVDITKKKEIRKPDVKTVKPTNTTAKETPKVVEKPRTPEEGSLFKGKSNKSTSQGTAATGTGDEGDRRGDPNSQYTGKSGTGTGSGSGSGSGGGDGDGTGPGRGSGISFDLSGRQLIRQPSIDDRSQEKGKVVVSITVDKTGRVVSAVPGARGSTTTSSYLNEKARQAAMTALFSPDPDGNAIQKGTITFNFILQ